MKIAILMLASLTMLSFAAPLASASVAATTVVSGGYCQWVFSEFVCHTCTFVLAEWVCRLCDIIFSPGVCSFTGKNYLLAEFVTTA